MSRITCTWNPNRGEETKITISNDFKELHYVEKLDFLQDIIGELSTLHDSILSDQIERKIK